MIYFHCRKYDTNEIVFFGFLLLICYFHIFYFHASDTCHKEFLTHVGMTISLVKYSVYKKMKHSIIIIIFSFFW
jgi:hypothetical protein